MPQIPDLGAEGLAVRDQVPVPGAAASGQLQAVYLPPLYHSERSLGAELALGPADAVKAALTRKVAVLTSGLGWGKSFTVRSVVELARARKAKVCSPRRPAAPPSVRGTHGRITPSVGQDGAQPDR